MRCIMHTKCLGNARRTKKTILRLLRRVETSAEYAACQQALDAGLFYSAARDDP